MSVKMSRLRKFNLTMGFLHLVQGLVILSIGNDSVREITTSFLRFNTSSQVLEPATRTLFSWPIVPLVALFFFISAIAHFYVSTVGRHWYETNLRRGINKARWYEYSLSASLMIVLIAMLSGIYDLGALLAMFGLTAVMNLMGLMMEIHNQTTERTSWLSYWIGVLAGFIPWLLIAIALWASQSAEGGQVPGFVYGIFVSLFVFFNAFAINMVLQYKKIGKWRDYLYGEYVYIILSLTAKSLLAWQIFAGTLQPV